MNLYEIKSKDINKYKEVKRKIYEDKAFRKKYFEKNFHSFCLFYFSHYFTSKWADFHKEWCKEFEWNKDMFLIAFRESAKTVFTILYIIWVIAYKKRNFILFYSYERKVSASRLFDIIVNLQTSDRFKNDFWEMFPANWKKTEELQKKSVWEFITTNKIKLKAMSMSETSRWLLYMNSRPDLLILDDIDNTRSVRNPEMIDKNEDFLTWEVYGWLDWDARIIWLWNIISNDWLVPRNRRNVENDDKWYLSFKPIIENWKIVWDRFVETDKEKEEWSKRWIQKISLEDKKRKQKENYDPNFLLIPNVIIWNPVFDHNILKELPSIEWKQDRRYKWLVFYKEPTERLFWGVDTSWWGADWDYSTIIIRNENLDLVARFKEKIAPDLLADVIIYIIEKGYKWLIWIESNNTGISTILKIRQSKYRNLLYVEKAIDKITAKPTQKFWFNTNAKSKPLIINLLEEYLREWVVDEFDEDSKMDMFNYYYDEKWSTNALKGSHDDLVIANAICLFMHNQPKKIIFK